MVDVVEKMTQNNPEDPEFMFWCPGCKCYHWWKTTGKKPRWTWNGDYEKPTVDPSIHVFPTDPTKTCHSFIRDGKIQFLLDSFHELKGQTIDMEPID